MSEELRFILVGFCGGVILLFVGYYFLLVPRYWRRMREVTEAEREVEETRKELAARRKEIGVEAKEEAHRLRKEVERENRERRQELQRTDRRLNQREENLERRTEALEKRDHAVQDKEADLARLRDMAQREREMWRQELESVAALTMEEARRVVLAEAEKEARHEAAMLLEQIEEETKRDADRKAREIISLAIQRCAVDQVAETTVAAVALPSDEMKGRIIGREGRNIRAFEQLTGVDLIIDDTPEAVVISAFDPIRRETARIALEALISDGRIHPGRIEDTVKKAQAQMDERIQQAGDHATFETGVTGLHPELVRLLGKMKFRTSLGQNALNHSVEVANIAGVMAAELEANEAIARRAGLLHDIGKAVDSEVEGTHTAIGVELTRRHRESAEVVHAIAAHHEDEPFRSIEAVLVYSADGISAARPGARRETLESYIKRLDRLEEIAQACDGVERCFAIQAGREVRILVKPNEVDDAMAAALAKEVADKIQESDLQYPGQIRVTVIRETRAVEYAK
ncbi:MAG: ribonuclease Y [Armatimonadota bacterium]|nr:ribonuclease Y [Armatimonadota bacterium]